MYAQLTELGKQTLKVIDARNAYLEAVTAEEAEGFDIWSNLPEITRSAFEKFVQEREIELQMEKELNQELAKAS